MAENKILPWAQTPTANDLSDADYAADVATGGLYADGVKSGQASSKQANKTWRQATAPGSGLAQFIVDNLALDVTDSDTPVMFSSRIANAVLKLAQISPFNQAWATATGGYRKYAIVSDSSGNFWVSTADQNTTVPGSNGANWRSLFSGYATESWTNTYFVKAGGGIDQDSAGDHKIFLGWGSNKLKLTIDASNLGNIALEDWANSAFVKNNAGTQGGIIALDLDKDGSGRASFMRADGSWGILQPAGDYATQAWADGRFQPAGNYATQAWADGRFQPAGDYATNTALNTETTNRTNADNNLQSQISAKMDGSFAASGIIAAGGAAGNGTIAGGTWLRVGNTLTQSFTVEKISSGTITFPVAFSGSDDQVTCIFQTADGSANTFRPGQITTTSARFHSPGGGGASRMTVQAQGPYGT